MFFILNESEIGTFLQDFVTSLGHLFFRAPVSGYVSYTLHRGSHPEVFYKKLFC